VVIRGSLVTLKNRPAHFVHDFEFVLELLGVGDHRAEFVNGEGRAVEAGALLLEKNGGRAKSA